MAKTPEAGASRAGNHRSFVEEMQFSSDEELATYIADMTLQLRNLAHKADMSFLAYLLEMSFQEAFELSQQAQGGADARGD